MHNPLCGSEFAELSRSWGFLSGNGCSGSVLKLPAAERKGKCSCYTNTEKLCGQGFVHLVQNRLREGRYLLSVVGGPVVACGSFLEMLKMAEIRCARGHKFDLSHSNQSCLLN